MWERYEFQPTRRFLVSLQPVDAVRFACEQWNRMGYRPDPMVLDPVLREQGEWTGVVLRRGGVLRGLFVGALLEEAVPWLSLVPGMGNLPGYTRLAVVARPAAALRGAELFCTHIDSFFEEGSTWRRPEYFTVVAASALTAPLQQAGLWISGPEKVRTRQLPPDHPFERKHWSRLKKEMRRRAKASHQGW